MRHLTNNLVILLCAAALFLSCKADYIEYSGPEYVAFSDTLFTCPVLQDGEEFNVTIASTTACDYDRTFGVEVIDKNSNAIEGYHYSLKANSVTIKAGERAAQVPVTTYYDHFEATDSVEFTLRLIEPEALNWDLYSELHQTRVLFQKCCPFDIHDFTGYCVVSSTFLYSYANSMNKLIKTEVDPDNDNSVILRNTLYDGDTYRDSYDLSLKFDVRNPLEPLVELNGDDSVFGNTRNALGYPYGDGWMRTYTSPSYTSYYNTCQGYVMLYHACYVANVGSIGTFLTMLEWVSDEEAERILREGF